MAGYVETILPFSEKSRRKRHKKPHSPATLFLILKERNSFTGRAQAECSLMPTGQHTQCG